MTNCDTLPLNLKDDWMVCLEKDKKLRLRLFIFIAAKCVKSKNHPPCYTIKSICNGRCLTSARTLEKRPQQDALSFPVPFLLHVVCPPFVD